MEKGGGGEASSCTTHTYVHWKKKKKKKKGLTLHSLPLLSIVITVVMELQSFSGTEKKVLLHGWVLKGENSHEKNAS